MGEPLRCANALHGVKDDYGDSVFLLALLGLPGARGCSEKINNIKQQFGEAIFVCAFLSWASRKLAVRTGILEEHGTWGDLLKK